MDVGDADGVGLGLTVAGELGLGVAAADEAEGVGELGGGADGDGVSGEHPTTSSTAPVTVATHRTRRPYV